MSLKRMYRFVRRGTDDDGLLLTCFLVGAVEYLLFAGTLMAFGGGPTSTVVWLLSYRLALVVLLAATLPVCYAIYRTGASPAEVPATAAEALRADGRAVLASSLIARMLAFLATVVAFATLGLLVLGLDTLAVWTDALVGLGVAPPLVDQWGFLAALLGAAWLVNGLLDYQDLLVIDGEAGVRDAWLRSARAVLARPTWFPRQALARGLLQATPWAVTLVAMFGLGNPWSDPVTILTLVALFAGVYAVSRATLVVYHVETAETIVEPALEREPTPVRDDLAPVAAAAVLVLAAAGGAAAVRTADVGPGPDLPPATVDEADPQATLERAIARTQQRSHAVTEHVEEYDPTGETWDRAGEVVHRIDPADRSLRIDLQSVTEDGQREWSLFLSDGIAATRGDGIRYSPIPRHPALTGYVTGGPWTGATGYSFEEMDVEYRYLAREDAEDWSLRTANDTTLVYAMTDPADFHDADRQNYLPDPDETGATYASDSELRAEVDRDSVTLQRVEKYVSLRSANSDVDQRRTTIAYEDVGATTVDRPDALGGPGPLETFWDVIYYA